MTQTTIDLGSGTMSTVQVARKPILATDSAQALLGYELLFRDSGELFSAFADVDEFRATSEVLSHSVLTLGVDAVVGNAMAFVRFPRAQVVDGTPLIMPPTQSAIELGRDTWVRGNEGIQRRIEQYREQGYRITLSDFFNTQTAQPLLRLADYVKVDVTGRDAAAIGELLEPVRSHDAQVIAVNVDTPEQRDTAAAAGIDYVQGFFFSAPKVVTGRELPGFKTSYLMLLRKAYEPDVDFEGLAEIVKTDVALSYKLLRYVNSAHFGLRGRIESVERALVMLGIDNVRRWVSVATVSGLTRPRAQELAVLCATRAHFCESLGQQLAIADPHDCFSLGMFSLLDVMLGRSMSEALADVSVSDRVTGALVGSPGTLADLLEIVVAYERGKWNVVSEIAARHGWPETELISLYIDAIEWSRDFFSTDMVAAA